MDLCVYVTLSLNFVIDKLSGYVTVCWGRWSLELGERKRMTVFQGDGENLQQVQSWYHNKNTPCMCLQTRQNLVHKNDQ